MLVSVLTVAYNSEKTIAKTIESVLNQSYGNIEYIIIDGNSADGTVDIAKSYLPYFTKESGKSLTVISEPDNGMYDALNKGAALCHGVLVGQINSDDFYEPDAVENMVNLYNSTDYDCAWGSLRILKPSGTMVKRAKIGKLWTTSGWCHPAMFTRREILLANPYPLESMYDDFDFITALHKSGKNLVTTNTVISNFTFGGMSTKKSIKECKKRADLTYSIYKKYGYSKFYYLHRLAFETAKFILG